MNQKAVKHFRRAMRLSAPEVKPNDKESRAHRDGFLSGCRMIFEAHERLSHKRRGEQRARFRKDAALTPRSLRVSLARLEGAGR